MSVRYEGARGKDLVVEAFGPGKRLGEDVMTDEVLVLNYDEVFYIEGTKWELLELLDRATVAVRSLPDPEDYKPFTVVGSNDNELLIDGVFEGHLIEPTVANKRCYSEHRFVEHVTAISPEEALTVAYARHEDLD